MCYVAMVCGVRTRIPHTHGRKCTAGGRKCTRLTRGVHTRGQDVYGAQLEEEECWDRMESYIRFKTIYNYASYLVLYALSC